MRRGAGGCRRVVGHSYGGAIISDAATGVANVVGLVFASAFAPDEGETLGELNARFAPPPGVAHFQVDSLGFVWLDPAAFPANFVQDVALQEARVMAAVQEPIGQPSPSRRGRRRGGGCRRGPGLHRCPDDLPRPAAVHGRPRRRQDRGGSLQQRLGGLPPPPGRQAGPGRRPGRYAGLGRRGCGVGEWPRTWTAAWRHRSA